MSDKHTKEPWSIEDGEQGTNSFYVLGPDRTAAVAKVMNYKLLGIGRDNARRIVACVNACAGIPTDDLEASPDHGLFHLAEFSNHLVLQRDELLAVLGEALEALDSARGNINPERGYADELEAEISAAIDKASSIMAKAKEGA